MKRIIIFFLIILAFKKEATAQQDTLLYYLKNTGEIVANKANADYFIVVLPPDKVDPNLFIINEFYADGKLKLQTKSIRATLPLQFQGSCYQYFDNGHKRSFQTYDNGKSVGDVILYYPNGNLYILKNQLRHNNEKMFLNECRDSTGNVICKDGNGKWISYDRDFKHWGEGYVKDGLEDGEWNGSTGDSIKYTCIFKKGDVVSGVGYDINGKAYPFKKIMVEPRFGLGMDTFYSFINRNMRYPEYARQHNITGKVIVEFTIEKDGTVDNVKIASGPAPSLNAEAIRLVASSPQWLPGKLYGIPVAVKYSVPIEF